MWPGRVVVLWDNDILVLGHAQGPGEGSPVCSHFHVVEHLGEAAGRQVTHAELPVWTQGQHEDMLAVGKCEASIALFSQLF